MSRSRRASSSAVSAIPEPPVMAAEIPAPPPGVNAAAEPTPAPRVEDLPAEESIPDFRRCPICWGRRKGYGLAYSTQAPGSVSREDWPSNVRRRFYKCAKALTELGPCGFTWVVTVEVQVKRVESRPVQLDTRD